MTTPALKLEVELAGDGQGWTDISRWVAAQPVRWERGITGGGVTDLVAGIGQLSFTLHNYRDVAAQAGLGYWSRWHTARRAGWDLDIGVRLSLQDPLTTTWFVQFAGRVDRIDPAPGRYRTRQVDVLAVDWMDEASRWRLTPDIGQPVNQRGNEILTRMLAYAPRPPLATSFDVGADVFPYTLDQTGASQPALTELAKIAASEQGPIYVTRTGTLRFERRHTRLLNTTVSWVIDDQVIHGDRSALQLPTQRADVVHTIRTTIHPKRVDETPTTVLAQLASAVQLPAGVSTTLLWSYRDPVTGTAIGGTDVQTPVAGTDAVMNAAPTGGGTDLTSALTVAVTAGASSAEVVLTNTGATDGYVTTLRLLGRGVYDRGELAFESSDGDTSGTALVDMPYQANPAVGQAAATFLRGKFGPTVTKAESVMVRGTTPTKVTQLLQRDISDRVTVRETVTGLDADFFLNGVRAVYQPGGVLDVTYTLSPATAPIAYWVLGTSVLGTDTVPAPF